jgi:hypothetical protein
MEDIKKKFADWIEKQEYYQKLEYIKKRASLIRKKKEELESMKSKMSETIY